MKAELNQEAVDNEVFSKAVKVNAVALSAVKSFLEVSKVLGVHRSTIISWRNNISLTDYNKYNQTSVTPEIALKRPMQNENYFLNICLFDCDIFSNRYHNYNLHDPKEMESLRIILSSSRDRNLEKKQEINIGCSMIQKCLKYVRLRMDLAFYVIRMNAL